MLQELRTLGYVISNGLIKSDPIKIQMLQNSPTPTTPKELRGFLGLLQFCRDMLPHLAYTAHKLDAATSSKTEFKWTDEMEEAYRAAKSVIEKDIMVTT